MNLLLSLLVAVAAAVFALSLPSSNLIGAELGSPSKRSGTPSSQGTHNGYFYSWWTDNQGDATYTLGSGNGTFTIRWSGNGNFIAGIGWNPGYDGR